MIPDGSSFATGLKIWTFPEPICGEKDEMALELSTCNDEEFTCKSDGECVAMKNRCDKYPNCADFSDEENCETVIIDASYVKDFAPLETFNETAYKRTEVHVKVDLMSIMEISEVDEVMETQFSLSLIWSDFRLTFHNLKEIKQILIAFHKTGVPICPGAQPKQTGCFFSCFENRHFSTGALLSQ